MVETLGNAVSGTIYNGAAVSLPRPSDGARPMHRPWCSECKRTVEGADDLDWHGHYSRCALTIVRRAEAATRRAAPAPVVQTGRLEHAAGIPPVPVEPDVKKPQRSAPKVQRSPKPRTPKAQRTPGTRAPSTQTRNGPPRIELPAAEVIEAYRSGKTLMEVADAFGVSHPVIRRLLVDHDEPRRGGKVQRTPELVASTCAAYVDRGQTVDEIAAETGMSTTTVRNLLVESGVTMRPQQPRADRNAAAISARTRRTVLDTLGATSADVRTWCRNNRVPVGVKGVPGTAAVDAYVRAHMGRSA